MELKSIRESLDRDIELAHMMADQDAWTFMQNHLTPKPTDPPAQPPEPQSPPASEPSAEPEKGQDEKPAT